MNKERIAIVTGSFDPITVGHVGIVRQAARLFDRLYVVAFSNEEKKHMFSEEDRREMIRLATEDISGVVVDAYSGWTADYMHAHGITTIVRGVRNGSDLAYEEFLSSRMKEFDPSFETILLPTELGMETVSSTAVREAILGGRPLAGLVPPAVEAYIQAHLNKE